MFPGWWPTPEQLEQFQVDYQAKVSALTEDQRAWLLAEVEHKEQAQARAVRETEAKYAEMEKLLEEDMEAFGAVHS